jgi:glycosyltransferase involved in cell wall biosynthesis
LPPDIGTGTRVFDGRWFGDHGIGRFAREIFNRLPGFDLLDCPGRPWDPLDAARTAWRLSATRPRLFFTPGYNAPLPCRCAIALSVHDLNHISAFGQSTALKRAYYNLILRPSIRRAAVVFTVSDYSRIAIAQWARVDPDKIINVSNGVSPSFDSRGDVHDNAGKRYFLAIASAKRHKNLPGMLEAYARSRSSRDVEFLLVGESNPELDSMLSRLKRPPSVRFLGKLSDAGLAAAYRGALAFVFASHYEGFGIPIVESMACGTPVITSRQTAMPETAGDAALLVESECTSEIADALDRVASSDSLRTELQAKGLQRAAQFTWAATADKVSRALRQINV